MVERVSKLQLILALGANLACSVTIVLLNKWIYTHYGFPSITLTCFHFILTTIGLEICKKFGIFQPKPLPFLEMIPLTLTFCGCVVFTNLSLEANSVGSYQLAKSMTTPALIVIQTYFYETRYSTRVKLTVVPILLGVILNCYNDIHFTAFGLVYATCGVLTMALQQVWVGEKQRKLQCNSMQLLYYQAPYSATFLGCVIPFFEPVFDAQGVFSPWSYEAVIMVLLSGIIAFSVNLSFFWIIGNTSALTFNMVGHMKFFFTLTLGVVLFHHQVNGWQICGTVLAFIGILCYSVLVLSSEPALSPVRHIKRKEHSS